MSLYRTYEGLKLVNVGQEAIVDVPVCIVPMRD